MGGIYFTLEIIIPPPPSTELNFPLQWGKMWNRDPCPLHLNNRVTSTIHNSECLGKTYQQWLEEAWIHKIVCLLTCSIRILDSFSSFNAHIWKLYLLCEEFGEKLSEFRWDFISGWWETNINEIQNSKTKDWAAICW